MRFIKKLLGAAPTPTDDGAFKPSPLAVVTHRLSNLRARRHGVQHPARISEEIYLGCDRVLRWRHVRRIDANAARTRSLARAETLEAIVRDCSAKSPRATTMAREISHETYD